MKKLSFFLLLWAMGFVAQGQNYFPEHWNWERKPPKSLQVDATALDTAVRFALAHEYTGERDLRRAILKGFSHEPYHQILGPTKRRGGPAGLIIKDGYIIAEWGDTKRVDMTFSVTKSYLSTMAGLAVDAGLIQSVDDKMGAYIWDGTFRGEHNSKISWRHLLNQSSDWSGQLFGLYDWADRPPREGDIDDWKYRELHEPGTFFKYNDVRVNVLAYSLLNIWRKPLPQVLKERIMDPIGASTTWCWYGYEHAFVNVDGIKMQSVSGGGHSGGGIFIHTEDHARFGLLFLNKGRWKDKQLISQEWINMATQSSKANANYGFMWWLNKSAEGSRMPALSENAYYAAGFGGNYIVIEPQHNLVIVARWLNPSDMNDFVELVLASMKE